MVIEAYYASVSIMSLNRTLSHVYVAVVMSVTMELPS